MARRPTQRKPTPKRKPTGQRPGAQQRRPAPRTRGSSTSRASSMREKMRKQLEQRLKEDQERRDSSGFGFFKEGTGAQFWKPEGGDHLVDIIPFMAGPDHPTVAEGDTAISLRVAVHYGIGPTEDRSVICPRETFLKDTPRRNCPICEHRMQLKSEGADDDVWKSLFPKKRGIYNIVCWDSAREEDKGVQVWDVSEFYFQKHLDTLSKGPRRPGREVEPFISYASPEEDGKSVAFTINPPRSRNDFAEYIGHRFEGRDYTIEDDILEQAHQLDQLVAFLSYDEIYREYWGEDPDEGDDRGGEESEEYYDDGDEGEPDEGYEGEPEPDDGDEGELVCPAGGEFGKDTNELEDCDQCEIWEQCAEAEHAAKETRRKPKPRTSGKPKRTLRRGR